MFVKSKNIVVIGAPSEISATRVIEAIITMNEGANVVVVGNLQEVPSSPKWNESPPIMIVPPPYIYSPLDIESGREKRRKKRAEAHKRRK